jgi:hypothetical protein
MKIDQVNGEGHEVGQLLASVNIALQDRRGRKGQDLLLQTRFDDHDEEHS